jgi:outer membrane receptor for ferrienterochelin and colicin
MRDACARVRRCLLTACAFALLLAESRAEAQLPSRRMVKVVGATDSAPVAGALIRRDSLVLGRTDLEGLVSLPVADSQMVVSIHALGFRVQRLTVTGGTHVVRLAPLPTTLPTFITTVGQRVIRSGEEARRVTVLERRDIDGAAAVSVNQLLRQLPGVQELPSPPARTSLSIRGFSDARVLVLVDGEPVPGSIMDSRDIGRLSTLSAERIEVTKGPSAVEYGSDAIGGVINIVQAAPTKTLTVDGTMRAGELGRRDGSLAVSNTIGRLGVRLNGGLRQVDQVTAINAAGSTFSRTWDGRADLRFRATDRLDLRLDVQSTMERQRWPLDGQFNGFIDNIGTQGLVEGTYRGLGGQLRLRGFAQRFAYQFRQAAGLAPIAGAGDSLEQREVLDRALLAYSTVRGRHTLDAGVQLSHRALSAPERVAGDRVTDVVREVYVRDAFATGPAQWTLGVRHTHGSLWGSATNPSLGVSVPLGAPVQLRANVARGFRGPSFKDIRYTFTNAGGGYIIEGNPMLIPERSLNTTIGARWVPFPALAFDVEGYRTDLRDMIDTRFRGIAVSGLQTFANVNIAQARTEGIEVNANGETKGVAWSLGVDWLRARDLEFNVPLSRRASQTVRARASRTWRVAAGLTGDLTVRHTGAAPLVLAASTDGSRPPAIGGEQGAMTAVDVQFRQLMGSGLELAAGANNLLGQRPALWTPAFDRQLFASVRWRWFGGAR